MFLHIERKGEYGIQVQCPVGANYVLVSAPNFIEAAETNLCHTVSINELFGYVPRHAQYKLVDLE